VRIPGGTAVAAAGAESGEVFAMIHPRAIAIYRRRPEGSPRNVWSGRASNIELLGNRVRVRIDGEVPLVAEVTPAALKELDLVEGGEVWVSFKATDVGVYPA
jgi:molybdate transport system ATP-binding protein